ncbi:MAG: hypothetical protein ACE5GM_08350 [bacterium]
MSEFQLFRIKAHPGRQTHLAQVDRKLRFETPESSPEILREAVFSLQEIRRERVWQVGNILPVEGCFSRSGIRNPQLADRLLREGVLEIDPHDEAKVYFHHVIKDEKRLKELLKRIRVEDHYRETILVFWRETLRESGLYFQLGKTARSQRSYYEAGRFVDEKAVASLYTNVILDIKYGLCAIARKSRLNPSTAGIANRFIKQLNQAKRARLTGVGFQADPVIDPEDFLGHLKQAKTIRKFWINFSKIDTFGENVSAANPFQAYLKRLGASSGKAEFKGAKLKAEPLGELSREIASSGHDAGALLQFEQDGALFSKHLKDNPVVFTQAGFADKEQRRNLLHNIRAKYFKISNITGNPT